MNAIEALVCKRDHCLGSPARETMRLRDGQDALSAVLDG